MAAVGIVFAGGCGTVFAMWASGRLLEWWMMRGWETYWKGRLR